jgi:fermentation-respiration switch protein FrsA (DUF1100 family)
MIGASLYYIQEKLIFLPTKLPHDHTFEMQVPFEEIFLKAEDGAMINGILQKAKNPKGVILYFHGNAGDLSRWSTITSYFVEKDYDVMVMDYRTYGKSTGKLSEKALYKDAQMYYDHLLKSYDESDIVLYGRSLGTGLATYLASQNNPRQILLETPYYDLFSVAKKRFPFFPVIHLMSYRFPSHEYIKKVTCPITIFHGTDDYIVPFDSGKRLFDAIGDNEKSFIEIEGGRHNDLIDFEEYHHNIDKALK